MFVEPEKRKQTRNKEAMNVKSVPTTIHGVNVINQLGKSLRDFGAKNVSSSRDTCAHTFVGGSKSDPSVRVHLEIY